MFPVDLEEGWEPVPQTSGIFVKTLSGDFDEPNAHGFRTRYARFEPGGETFAAFTHDYWEESFLIEGELTLKDGGVVLKVPCYVIRPPGTPHGPFISHGGCMQIEVQYFAERGVGLKAYLDGKAP